MNPMDKSPDSDSAWAWFLVPLILVAALAAALYLFGDGGPFSGGSGYDLR